jgi:sortase B
MTAYYKRPMVRGKVYESQKNAVSSTFIEWVEPSKPLFKLLFTLCGFLIFMVLSAFNWFTVESFGMSKFGLLTSLDIIENTFIFSTINTLQLGTLELMLKISAAALGISMILVILSMLLCKTRARLPLVFTGFAFGALSPLVFIITTFSINHTLAIPPIEPTLFGFFALLTAIISLIYCGKYPALTAIRDRRNSFFTKALTSLVPVRDDGVRESIRKTIFTGALVCFVWFGVPLGFILYSDIREEIEQNRRDGYVGYALDPNHPVRGIFTNKPAVPLEKYLKLFSENQDFVGYIRVGDTRVNYPVVQADNNDHYLHFAFDGTRNSSGAIFADYRNRFNGFDISDNTVLFGHNVRSGSFFARLTQYWRTTTGWNSSDLSFYKENPVIQFDTLYEEMEWKVFACVLFNTETQFGEVIDYWKMHDFDTEEEFHDFIFMIMDRSVLLTDVDIQYGDKILTLSTCYYPLGTRVNTRVVVFARKIRPGESRDVDVDVATYNKYHLRFEEQNRSRSLRGEFRREWNYEKYLLSYEGGRS